MIHLGLVMYIFSVIFLCPFLSFSSVLVPIFPLPPLLPCFFLGMFSFNKATFSQQTLLHQLTHHCFMSWYRRHGGHPAAPSLACRFQSEHGGPARAGRQLPLPRHEALGHIRLRIHLLLLCSFFPVSPTCVLHLFRGCSLWPQSTSDWRTPDQHGLHKWAQLQDGVEHTQ